MADIVLEDDDAAVVNTSWSPQERKKSSTVWTLVRICEHLVLDLLIQKLFHKYLESVPV